MPLPPDYIERITLVARLAAFAIALSVVGAFFLPWVRIDGIPGTASGADLVGILLSLRLDKLDEPSSGAEFIAQVGSPTVDYLFAVSQLQAGILVGGPILAIVSALRVVGRYQQRRKAVLATCILLVSSLSVMLGTRDLTAGVSVGLTLTVTLSAVLLIHQALITVAIRFYWKTRLRQTLLAFTGGGSYRWRI